MKWPVDFQSLETFMAHIAVNLPPVATDRKPRPGLKRIYCTDCGYPEDVLRRTENPLRVQLPVWA